MITPVDLGKHPLSPPVGDDLQGVVIRVETRLVPGAIEVALHGAYQVSAGTAHMIGAVPLHRALVVTAVNGYAYGSMSLLGPALAFEDDESASAGVVRGYFNAELTCRAPDFPWKGARVMVSMGPFVSNVATAELPEQGSSGGQISP